MHINVKSGLLIAIVISSATLLVNNIFSSWLATIQKTQPMEESTHRPAPEKITLNKNATDALLGSYISDSSGEPAPNQNYNATGYIPVTEGTAYKFSNRHMIAWYAKNKKFIIGNDISQNSKPQIAPPDAAYVRATVDLHAWDQFEIEVTPVLNREEILSQITTDHLAQLNSKTNNPISISSRQFIPANKEVSFYYENIIDNYISHRGRVDITFAGGRETGESTKFIPTSDQIGKTIYGMVRVAGPSFETNHSEKFEIVVTDPQKNTPANIQHIGDSLTTRMALTNVINNSPVRDGLTYIGTRTSTQANPAVRNEGQGGWVMDAFHTVDFQGYLSPFMQPVNAGYLYYGQTSFWVDANSKSPSYNAGSYYETINLFDPKTGRKISPMIGDVMGEGGHYINWNGSEWVPISSTDLGGFSFDYGKYRKAWAIPAPTIVHILIGTNDFHSDTDETFDRTYANYKTKYDKILSSIKADTPNVKVIIGIPISSGKQGTHGTLTTKKAKHAYHLLAVKLNSDYGNRENESIYILDYHSILDRVYGFNKAYEPPFSDYAGTPGDNSYTDDTTHPSADGFNQMGNAYMGLIQYLR
jgi:lysophospholipase L1-like esterase